MADDDDDDDDDAGFAKRTRGGDKVENGILVLPAYQTPRSDEGRGGRKKKERCIKIDTQYITATTRTPFLKSRI